MGLAKRMVAGGSEGASPYIWAGFDAMRVMSRKFNDNPASGSRPLSASACGFVPGSGGAMLVLEELETALVRGARIYAEIIGGYVNSGGQRMGGSMTAPNSEGVRRCIRGAVADAGIKHSDVDAVNGHLTASYADPYEVKNWAAAAWSSTAPPKHRHGLFVWRHKAASSPTPLPMKVELSIAPSPVTTKSAADRHSFNPV